MDKLIARLLTVDVSSRISIDQLLNLPIVANQLNTLKAMPTYQNEFTNSMIQESRTLNRYQPQIQQQINKPPVQMFIEHNDSKPLKSKPVLGQKRKPSTHETVKNTNDYVRAKQEREMELLQKKQEVLNKIANQK